MNAQVKAVPNAPQQPAVDYNATKLVDAHSVFPEVYQPGEKKIKMRVNRHPDCLPSNKHYVPDERVLKLCIAWWNMPIQPQAFGLVGETGTGKTELLLYVADRLNEPVYMVKCHAGLMPEDLEGSRILVDGKTPFQPGPAVKGYSHGGLIIFDEIDKVNQVTGAALHGLLEGKPWPVEQIGVTLSKSRMCRIAATGNTTGEGGDENYSSSQKMDDALRSRIGWLRTFYPQPSVELKILTNQFPKLSREMCLEMIRVGTELRSLRIGQDGKRLDDAIGAVFSTRTLVNWAFYTLTFGQSTVWRESFNFAAQGAIDSASQDTVDAVLQRLLGEIIDMPAKEAEKKIAEKK